MPTIAKQFWTRWCCYILVCGIVKEGIAVVNSAAMVLATESDITRRIRRNRGYGKTITACFRYMLFEIEGFIKRYSEI